MSKELLPSQLSLTVGCQRTWIVDTFILHQEKHDAVVDSSNLINVLRIQTFILKHISIVGFLDGPPCDHEQDAVGPVALSFSQSYILTFVVRVVLLLLKRFQIVGALLHSPNEWAMDSWWRPQLWQKKTLKPRWIIHVVYDFTNYKKLNKKMSRYFI